MPLFHVPSSVPIVNERKTLSPVWLQLHTNMAALLNQGYPAPQNNVNGQLVPTSATIPLVKLTPGGAAGSLTFTNGILTQAVNPT